MARRAAREQGAARALHPGFAVKVALVNPPWSFEGSIYFGCRESHLPLEYGYAKALLEREGHEALLVDAQLGASWGDRADVTGAHDDAWIRGVLETFRPDLTVLTTAPSYLFWRCAPPELRIPMGTAEAIRDVAGTLCVVGPHASTTPRATLRKLRADVAVVGECEDVIVRLANEPPRGSGPSIVWPLGDDLGGSAVKHATDVKALPALKWPAELLRRHRHHHHRFDRKAVGAGGELEASRGCPYHCTFCAKDNFRDAFR